MSLSATGSSARFFRDLYPTQLVMLLWVVLALLVRPLHAGEPNPFPRPEALKPAVSFWKKIYTEISSGSGYIHDSRNLAIIYTTLHFKWYESAQVQEREIQRAKKRYRKALLAVANGKRKNLSADENKVLALWGKDVSAKTLKTAAENQRFQRGQADRFREGIIRAGAWEKRIQETLSSLELPQSLAAIPHVESSYNSKVHSKIGAAGLWQFTRFTGRHYLRVDHVVDERLDPLKSTGAAARLLLEYHSVLKSWPLAITAYNHGLSGVRKAVRKTKSNDIGVIVEQYEGPRFGFASRNFYAAFLAASDVSGDSQDYFGTLERDQPEAYWVVKTPVYLPLQSLIEQLKLDAETVKALNPALQASVWNGSKYLPQGFHLRLPVDAGSEGITALLTTLASAEGHSKQIPDRYYTVKRGDTLSGIASRHKVRVRDLMAVNSISSKDRILVGQVLRWPGSQSPEAVEFAGVELVANESKPASF